MHVPRCMSIGATAVVLSGHCCGWLLYRGPDACRGTTGRQNTLVGGTYFQEVD